MIQKLRPFFRLFDARCALTLVGILTFSAIVFADSVPGNLGSGLDVLVRARQEQQASKAAARRGRRDAGVDTDLAQRASEYRDMAIVDDSGMVKVYVHLRPRAIMENPAALIDVLPKSALVTAVDEN